MAEEIKRGFFVIVDGLDGSGKSVIVNGLSEYLKKQGKRVFELKEFWKTSHSLPEPEELYDYDVIISAEPTYSLVGGAIRDELIKSGRRSYSAFTTATAYALDRVILYRRVILPMLSRGKTVIQDRGVTTSIIYQPIQAEPLSLKKVLSFEGNQLAMENRPDLLIIADAKPEVCMERLWERSEKKDSSIFENPDFLKKAYKRFRSKWFRKLFEDRGSRVVYLDASKSKEQVVSDAVKLLQEFSGK